MKERGKEKNKELSRAPNVNKYINIYTKNKMTYLKSSIQKTHFLSTAFGSMLGYRRKKRNDVMMWNGPRDELYYFFHLSPITILIL